MAGGSMHSAIAVPGADYVQRFILFALSAIAPLLVPSTESPAEANESLYAPAGCCEIRRAGYPYCVSRVAAPANTCRYDGYQVGGGAFAFSHADQCSNQGTWGWDYVGEFFPRFVQLGWWHNPREQGGTGRYEPDGPHCFEAFYHK